MILFGETRCYYPVGSRVPGLYRVATIGDSFTYGAAVVPSETLASHVERALNAAFIGLFFETVNLGRNGSNFWHAWSTFEGHYAERGFDAVLLSVCNNDTSLFDGNGVRYKTVPWSDSIQVSLLRDDLRRIKRFTEQNGILLIVYFYSFAKGDIFPISVTRQACEDAGVPFIDMRSFLEDQLGRSPRQHVASVLDGHPSGHTHSLAARRIVDEISHLQFFPRTDGPIDISHETWRLTEAMRNQGRSA